jgi:hypothetical protein
MEKNIFQQRIERIERSEKMIITTSFFFRKGKNSIETTIAIAMT